MPHVAVLFEFPTLNGGERSMLAVLGVLHEHSTLHFSAIAPGVGSLADELRQLGIPLIPFSVRDELGHRPAPALLHRRLLDALDQINPDILHSNSLSMSRLSGQLETASLSHCRRTGHLRDIIKLNATVVSDLNQNDTLVAVSNATRQFHVAQGVQPERCQVIYNGVDTEQFQPRDAKKIRAALFPGLPADSKLLLSVGQICLRKSQLDAAKAVCGLLEDRDDIHLAIAGERHSTKAESIEYEAALQQVFDAAGRSDHLHMLGYRTDVDLLMNAADVLVHAAWQEPFGRTLLEAAASALPIVATNVGGTSEMLRHGCHAILVPPGQPDALSAAIGRLIDDPDVVRALTTSARLRVEQLYSIRNAAENLAEFWNAPLPASVSR